MGHSAANRFPLGGYLRLMRVREPAGATIGGEAPAHGRPPDGLESVKNCPFLTGSRCPLRIVPLY